MSSSSYISYTLWVFLPASWIQRPSSSVAFYFFNQIFLLSFWNKTIKIYIYGIKSIFRPPLLPGSIFSPRAPLLQVLHAPPLPRTAELQDGEGHSRASVRGVSPAPQSRGTVQLLLRCFAAHHSQCLWNVSSGVTWAFEACLRKINKRQWRRLYIKTWQKS